MTQQTQIATMDPVKKSILKITLKPAYEARNTADTANDVKYAEFTKDLLEHIKNIV
jgi:non-homologous end joining protein Ku